MGCIIKKLESSFRANFCPEQSRNLKEKIVKVQSLESVIKHPANGATGLAHICQVCVIGNFKDFLPKNHISVCNYSVIGEYSKFHAKWRLMKHNMHMVCSRGYKQNILT